MIVIGSIKKKKERKRCLPNEKKFAFEKKNRQSLNSDSCGRVDGVVSRQGIMMMVQEH